MRVKRLAAVVVMSLCLATTTSASNWTGGDGDWSLGTNWSAGVPDGTDAYIGNGQIVTLDTDEPDITTLDVSWFSTLNIEPGAGLTASGEASVASGGNDTGIVAQSGGVVSLESNLIVGPAAGSIATWTMTDDGALAVGTDLTLGGVGQGTFELKDTSKLTVAGNINIATSGGSGTMTVSGGTLGQLAGGGDPAILADLTVGSTGTFAVEGSTPAINVASYTQQSGGALDIALGDTGVSPILVSGEATLSGALNVTVAGGTPDGVYDIINADLRTSGFDTTNLPAGVSVWYGETDVKLYVGIDPPPGSYGLRGPYVPDANTLHLYHFNGGPNPDESTTAAIDSAGTLDLNMTGYHNPDNPTTVGETASAIGFDECFDVDTSHGYTGQISGSVSGPVEAVGSTDGAWTAEGIVKWNGYNDSLHVFNVSGSYIRVIVYPSAPYILVDIGADSQITLNDGTTYDRNFPIPAPQANEWYHWAVTYNGLEDTADNVQVYWTPLDPDYTEAQLMDSRRAKLDQGGSGGSFGTAYRLCGWADEMRISDIVRAPDDMMFGTGEIGPPVIPEPGGLGLVGLALLAVRRRRS